LACWYALVSVSCALAQPEGLHAQKTATVDVGVSSVRYDGFLPSGAVAVSPSLKWDRPQVHLGFRGTYLRFESGSRSLQGLITGSVLTPPALGWRGELGVTGGASSYADFASFWHSVGEARLLRVSSQRGAWLGVSAGRTSFGTAPRPIAVAALAAWGRASWITLVASATHSWVGDTAYTDVESTARGRRGPFLLEGSLGARLWSRGGGHGVYGEGNAAYDISERAAIVVSGGRYPTDPLRGSISGRYVTVAVRLRGWRPSRTARVARPDSNPASSTAVLRLEVLRQRNGAVQLTLRAPRANRVEIAGDFTDWQPVALTRLASGAWGVALKIPSGAHRIDVRVDGGGWLVPAGTTRMMDDYDGEVGMFVVP
jgi:hypothetical protein